MFWNRQLQLDENQAAYGGATYSPREPSIALWREETVSQLRVSLLQLC
jgi:hypothetical protein